MRAVAMSKGQIVMELPPRAVAFNRRGDVLALACDSLSGKTSLVTYDYLHVEGMLEALCMALHPRLGAHSPLAVLDGAADVLEKAWRMTSLTRLQERARAEGGGRTLSIAFSPDGRFLVSGGEDGDVVIWDAAGQLSEACRLQGHTERVTCVDYNPAGTFVASSSWDCSIRLWDPRTGLCTGVLSGHDEVVSGISFSPDGLVLASSGMDETSVRLWSVNTGYQKEITLRGLPKSTARAVEFSPDGRLLAVACRDWTVRMYDSQTGMPIGVGAGVMSSHWGLVSCVKFSPDGTLLASGSDDGTVRMWRTATGQQVGQALQHMACVNGMAFCNSCSDLATASGDLWTTDRALHIWNGRDTSIIQAKRADFAVAAPTSQQLKETRKKIKALRRKQQALGINTIFGSTSDGEEQEDETQKERQRIIADVWAYRQWLEHTGRMG